ncbi:hypothetical protein NDU88_011918, partial [Pleurodeles waltl]
TRVFGRQTRGGRGALGEPQVGTKHTPSAVLGQPGTGCKHDVGSPMILYEGTPGVTQ